MERRANEYLSILQDRFGDDVKITAMESYSEWGTRNYEIAIYLESEIIKQIRGDRQKRMTYCEDGIASCLDLDGIYTGDDFEKVVTHMFYDFYHNGKIK